VKRFVFVAIVATALVGCTSAAESSENYTVAEKLSAIDTDGDVDAEARQFQRALDCVVDTAPGTETERKVADVWVATWKASGSEKGGLLELAQGTCRGIK
jgi:hypothetical protein